MFTNRRTTEGFEYFIVPSPLFEGCIVVEKMLIYNLGPSKESSYGSSLLGRTVNAALTLLLGR